MRDTHNHDGASGGGNGYTYTYSEERKIRDERMRDTYTRSDLE